MQLTRRTLLGGIGLGALGVGVGMRGRGHPDFTHYTYASPGDVDDRRLRVAWYERYNGQFLEHQAGTGEVSIDEALDSDSAPEYVAEAAFVTDGTGPVIDVGNLMPGDEGALVVGLENARSDDVVAEPLDVWLRATVTGDDENVLSGPEVAAGDTPGPDGELDDELVVELWRDGSPLGRCNGHREVDEHLETPVVSHGPMSEVFGPATAVGSNPGTRVVRSVAPGDSRCVALGWAFPSDTATNRSQGDAVRFELRFGGVPTDARSPFAEPGPEEA